MATPSRVIPSPVICHPSRLNGTRLAPIPIGQFAGVGASQRPYSFLRAEIKRDPDGWIRVHTSRLRLCFVWAGRVILIPTVCRAWWAGRASGTPRELVPLGSNSLCSRLGEGGRGWVGARAGASLGERTHGPRLSIDHTRRARLVSSEALPAWCAVHTTPWCLDDSSP